jgi:uncharacterized membrane protein YhiD involved in acid resistance
MMTYILNSRLGFDDLLNQDYSQLFEEVTLSQIGLCLLLTCLLAAFIFVVYRLNYRGSMYSYSFNASLIGMCLITSIMMMAISSNIVLSLGMVGALSIVRFRTPIKDPIDTVYIYWSICAGITCGVGIYGIAIVGNLLIGIIITVLARISLSSKRILLVIKFKKDGSERVDTILNDKYVAIKSKFINNDQVEYNVVVKKESSLKNIEAAISHDSGLIALTQLNYEE